MDEDSPTLRQKAERYRRIMQEADDQRLKEAAADLVLDLERKAAEMDRLAAELKRTAFSGEDE